MTKSELGKMIRKFEETGSVSALPGGERKPASTEVIGEVVLMVGRASNSMSTTIIRHVETALDQLIATVHKILRKNLLYYPYKMSHVE